MKGRQRLDKRLRDLPSVPSYVHFVPTMSRIVKSKEPESRLVVARDQGEKVIA